MLFILTLGICVPFQCNDWSFLCIETTPSPATSCHRMSRSPEVREDPMECPLCMEPLEIDDVNFFPCTCGYQICRFCWHRIRTDENGLCPACRKVWLCVKLEIWGPSETCLHHFQKNSSISGRGCKLCCPN